MITTEYKHDLKRIVGIPLYKDWLKLLPKLYYKDGKPHGVLATHQIPETPDITYIFCGAITPNTPFTIAMVRDIILLHSTRNVCLLSEHRPAFAHLKRSLTRYGYTFKENEGILYAYRYILKEKEKD